MGHVSMAVGQWEGPTITQHGSCVWILYLRVGYASHDLNSPYSLFHSIFPNFSVPYEK